MEKGRSPARLPLRTKVRTAPYVWWWFLRVHLLLRRRRLPEIAALLARPRSRPIADLEPRRWSRVVNRALTAGPLEPRCLIRALVLYRVLHANGERGELVIGLPQEPKDKDAHAWIEIDGIDVGPPPGRSGHEELARYG